MKHLHVKISFNDLDTWNAVKGIGVYHYRQDGFPRMVIIRKMTPKDITRKIESDTKHMRKITNDRLTAIIVRVRDRRNLVGVCLATRVRTPAST